jgi:hypothetical protein
MLTVSQLSKSFASLEVRFGESGIRRVVVAGAIQHPFRQPHQFAEFHSTAR